MNLMLPFSKIALVTTAAATLCFAQGARANVPDGFDLGAWNNWLANVITTGTPNELPNGIYLTMSKISPADTTKTHLANYFSTVGGYDSHQHFIVDHIEDVSENWVIAEDGSKDVDQWLFRVSTTGDVQSTTHMHLKETADGGVISDDSLKPSPEEASAEWIAQLNLWYAVTTGSGQNPQ